MCGTICKVALRGRWGHADFVLYLRAVVLNWGQIRHPPSPTPPGHLALSGDILVVTVGGDVLLTSSG